MMLLSTLGALTIAFLLVFWATPLGAPALRRLGQGRPSPDLTFGYAPDDTYQLLGIYGPAGRAHWRRLLLLDMVFPAVYGAFLALALDAWAQWAEAGAAWHAVALACPLVCAAADYLENLLLLRVIAAWPQQRPGLVSAASVCTQAKFASFAAALLVPPAHAALSRVVTLF